MAAVAVFDGHHAFDVIGVFGFDRDAADHTSVDASRKRLSACSQTPDGELSLTPGADAAALPRAAQPCT